MALWSKSSPASFCLSRYAPPLLSCETGWKWHRNFISSGFYTLGDVRAAMSVELRVSKCATKMDGPNRIKSTCLVQTKERSAKMKNNSNLTLFKICFCFCFFSLLLYC
ncbi:hypothetical protein ATANTOWER_029221 [Ataeniobius toweri]|uniref:Uncharacterized protein n=1 Tax=Ataeniobius toweri TaxID=208326 RepID=A0ABU7ASV5_9TELE|nr:hypothetical protein [Ataeniobius toweri]